VFCTGGLAVVHCKAVSTRKEVGKPFLYVTVDVSVEYFVYE